MAEAVVSVVASGVSLASFALQLLDTAVRLRRLWSDIKDAPEEVIYLLTEIEVLAHILGAIKEVHTPAPSNDMFDAVFHQCLSLCEQSARAMERLARDLEKLITQKRSMGAFRVVLKKDIVADHRSRLERAKTSLLLAQQTYISMQQTYHTSLHVQQLQKVDAILVSQERLLSPPPQNASRSHTSGCMQTNSIPDPRESFDSGYNVIMSPGRTTLVKRRGPAHHRREKDRLRFRTPTWLTSRVWEVHVKESCSGWMLGLSSYHIRPSDALVFKYAKDGDIQNLQQLFDEGKASPFDRSPNQETLLHFAVWGAKPEVCRFLLEQGVDSKAEDFVEWTPLRYLVVIGGNQSLEMYRLLVQEADTDELTDGDSVFELLRCIGPLEIPPDAMQLLQQEMCFSWADLDFEKRVWLCMWTYNADLTRLFLGPGPLQKDHFDIPSSETGGRYLFSQIAKAIGRSRRWKDGDVSWQAFLHEAIALNAHLLIYRQRESPLAAFLDSLWLDHTQIGRSEQPQLYWLQSLQRAGVDLVEYGRLEKSLLSDAHSQQTIRIFDRIFCLYGQVRIINITYGPEPEDWHVWFSWPLDEWSGDFWYMVENPELFDIPGAWLPE